MIEISKELNHLEKVPVDSLQEFQGDLKDLTSREYSKLKKSLLEFGFITPIFTWGSKIIDGHQRLHVMINEGWIQDVPILRISAHNEQDAKRKLLVISSQYGRVTQEGFDEFTFDLDDDWLTETVQFDALPFIFNHWGEQPNGWEDAMGGLPDSDRSPFQQMTFTLHDSQVEQVKTAVSIAKNMGKFDSENENSNGNALARICETFVTDYGQG